MSISGIGAQGAAGLAEAGPGRMGKAEFMQLLVAQLANQDPLSPMDSHAFVAQLAQFSSLELMQAQSSTLETLVLAQAASNQMQAASLVGHEVAFNGGAVTLAESGPVQGHAYLEAPAAKVTVTIADAQGKVVRTLELPAQGRGEVVFSWDGLDADGVRAPPGEYTLRVAAQDVHGGAVAIQPRGRGTITGVSFENGYAELLVGDRRIKLSDVIQIEAPEPRETNP